MMLVKKEAIKKLLLLENWVSPLPHGQESSMYPFHQIHKFWFMKFDPMIKNRNLFRRLFKCNGKDAKDSYCSLGELNSELSGRRTLL
uniref:T4.8 protein n=1 Tax=Malus x robusta TaxID=1184610 RepID=I7JQ38_9ROSA|nr:T4.8 [Malus x robusta]